MDQRRLHNWLRATSGDAFRAIADEIALLKRIAPGLYADLPDGDAGLMAGLESLEASKLARREVDGDDERWFYCSEPVKEEAQAKLF